MELELSTHIEELEQRIAPSTGPITCLTVNAGEGMTTDGCIGSPLPQPWIIINKHDGTWFAPNIRFL